MGVEAIQKVSNVNWNDCYYSEREGLELIAQQISTVNHHNHQHYHQKEKETQHQHQQQQQKKKKVQQRRKREQQKGMGSASNIGKYKLGRTIGEGTFAKVKLAKNIINGQSVAIKIIDKIVVMENSLMYQVQREIRTMKLLNHPNIVRIHEVLGTKTKIYIVMDYVSGGQLSDKLSYVKRLSKWEARKYFQQLIDALEYCHCRGVCHRDLKPQNLLLDCKGNLKISDFGLSALRKPGALLSTACGSPCYVAPELLRNKGYDGAAVDVWACGVILFELLAGYLPFDDRNLLNLYKKIMRAEYKCPEWFTAREQELTARIFDPNPKTRITVPEIIEDEWFQKDYIPAVGFEFDEKVATEDAYAAFVSEDKVAAQITPQTPGFINAFQLIAMSYDLDLSGLFEEKDDDKHRIMLGSKHTISETIERIEAAARDACLSFERMHNFKIKLQPIAKAKGSRPCFNLLAEVIEVSPTDCVVEISKSNGERGIFKEFCKSLSNLLREPAQHLMRQISKDDSMIGTNIRTAESCCNIEASNELRGYSSS
ncbi:CBL-interacting serine/threonine-protein kinase 21 [Ancistrocladus abbreviatus]